MKRRFDRDLMVNANLRHVANASVAVIDRLQAYAPHEQIAGAAASFILMCEHFGVSPQDAFATATNIMNQAEGRRAEFEAVRLYLENEV